MLTYFHCAKSSGVHASELIDLFLRPSRQVKGDIVHWDYWVIGSQGLCPVSRILDDYFPPGEVWNIIWQNLVNAKTSH